MHMRRALQLLGGGSRLAGQTSKSLRTSSSLVRSAVDCWRHTITNLFFLHWSGKTGDRTIFQITTKHGISISEFSAIPNEAELMLAAGAESELITVISIWRHNKRDHNYMGP